MRCKRTYGKRKVYKTLGDGTGDLDAYKRSKKAAKKGSSKNEGENAEEIV